MTPVLIWVKNSDGDYTASIPGPAGYVAKIQKESSSWYLQSFTCGLLLTACHRPTLKAAKNQAQITADNVAP